jgi:hypothetical protein
MLNSYSKNVCLPKGKNSSDELSMAEDADV